MLLNLKPTLILFYLSIPNLHHDGKYLKYHRCFLLQLYNVECIINSIINTICIKFNYKLNVQSSWPKNFRTVRPTFN